MILYSVQFKHGNINSVTKPEHGCFLALHPNQMFLSSEYIIILQKLARHKKAMAVLPY